MSLENKITIVTGGVSGIGGAIVERFHRDGATVIAADVTAEDRQVGERRFHVQTDVSSAPSVERLFEKAVHKHQRVDIVINSAGIGKDLFFLDTSEEDFDRIIAVNLKGTFLVGRAAARLMRDQGGGRIVNISSVSGCVGNVGRAAYGASKGGIVTLSQVMAVELASAGILVNVIAPGPVETPLVRQMHTEQARAGWLGATPLKRYASPEEIAGAAAFLAGPDASYITGHVLHVDGGFLAGGLLPS